jgi:hypothetical protein
MGNVFEYEVEGADGYMVSVQDFDDGLSPGRYEVLAIRRGDADVHMSNHKTVVAALTKAISFIRRWAA